MSGIIRSFKTAYADMERKGWDKIYVFVDLHSTAIKPNYSTDEVPKEFYDLAEETLQIMSDIPEICLVMYTCSHPHEIEQYKEFFKSHGINFEYINKNDEVTTEEGGYGYYEDKPYMNVLLDDKAGFFPDEDWVLVRDFLIEKYAKTNA